MFFDITGRCITPYKPSGDADYDAKRIANIPKQDIKAAGGEDDAEEGEGVEEAIDGREAEGTGHRHQPWKNAELIVIACRAVPVEGALALKLGQVLGV